MTIAIYQSIFSLILVGGFLSSTSLAATCSGGTIGDGICVDKTLCCSRFGWCGLGPDWCDEGNTASPPTPAAAPTITGSPPSPVPPTVPVILNDDSRMIAYMGNWHTCPTAAQLTQYTHVVLAFAVSYTWAPGKNQCDTQCNIATPPVCNNAPNDSLISDLHAAGKKIILSFGGAGMGGSWSSSQDDCWDYCFGKEEKVVSRLTEIIDDMNLDGIDIDYEYFYEDNQNGSGFTKGAQAQKFLTEITVGLRNSLPAGSIVTHAPMDSDLVPGKAFYKLLKDISGTLDFIMPQYYNGLVRPALDGVDESGFGQETSISLYSQLANDYFGGDATKIVFGFCIKDCSGTNSNANAVQAAAVMSELSSVYDCNGGAFFWVVNDDTNGSWSSQVNQVVQLNAGCAESNSPSTVAPSSFVVTTHPSAAPTKQPNQSPMAAPTKRTPNPSFAPTSKPSLRATTAPSNADGFEETKCCPPDFTGLRALDNCSKFFHCVGGAVVGPETSCGSGLLFDQKFMYCNWSDQVTCVPNVC